MLVRLLPTEGAFLDSLSRTDHTVFAVCGRSRTPAPVLARIGTLAETRGHRDLLAIPELRPEAEREIDDFFRAAARSDPAGRFAFTARVPLSALEYEDLQLAFLLLAFTRRTPSSPVLVLARDAGIHRLFAAVFLQRPMLAPARWPGLYAWLRLARSALRALLAPRVPAETRRVVIFTLGSAVAAGRPDSYFGRFAEQLGAIAPTVTVYLAEGGRVTFPRNDRALPLESFVSWRDLMRTALEAGSARQDYLRPAGRVHALLADFLCGREIRRGEPMMLALYRGVFPAMIRRLQPQIVLFPLECRTWEKHLVAACREQRVQCSIGYQHASITPRHLAFRLEQDPGEGRDLPDRIVACGDITAQWLARRLPALGGRVSAGVALRSVASAPGSPARPGVLVTLSSTRAEAWALMQATARAARSLPLPFYIRRHPTIAVDDLFRQIRWEGQVELSNGRTMLEDIERATLIVYSSSTVALEGMRHGRIPVFLDIGDVPSGDPVGADVSCRFSAASAEELIAVLERLTAMPTQEIERLRAAARDFGSRYLRVPDAAGIAAMAEAVLRC